MHEFKLTFPEQSAGDTLRLLLFHLPSGDNCRAFVYNEMEFDVSVIAEKMQQASVLTLNKYSVIKR